jgi:hypothetical protein
MDAFSGQVWDEEADGIPSFAAELSTTREAKPRVADRVEVSFSAALRQRGASGVSVQVVRNCSR